MKNQISAYIDHTITFLLLLLAGLTPVLFLNNTTEFFEMPKLILLSVSTILLFGLWIFSWILKGKVVITRTPLDIPLLLLLVVVLVSTYFSATRYPSIYGNFPRVHGSAISWVTYILLYFVTVSHLKNIGQIKIFLYTLYGSAVVVMLVTLLSFFGLYLPFDFARGFNFTPTGSSFSTIALLTLLLPLPLLAIINPNKYMPMPVAVTLASLFGITVVLIGSLPTLILLALTFALCLFITKPTKIKKRLLFLMIPAVITSLVVMLAYLPVPGNKINDLSRNFPREIQLPITDSWKIAASAFRDAPFIGTGPSSFLFDFTAYKPVQFNTRTFWNFTFDTAYNEFLQIFATLGLVGLAVLAYLVVTILRTGWKSIADSKDAETADSVMPVLLSSLAIAGFVSVGLLAVHATTLVSLVVTLFMLALLMASQKSILGKESEFSLGIKAATSGNRQIDLLPIVIFIVYLVLALPGFYQAYRIIAADYFHRQALVQADQNGRLTYQLLQRAESLNPYIDMYRVDMARTNFAIANAIAGQKGPTEASPAGSLTDQDRQTIQTLLSQTINEGRAAVALSPRSARNWEILGSTYRNITGVAQNALAFSLDAYGRAIQLDPLNPVLRVNVGGIYYSVRNYDLAIRFFSDAANLKPDYANAYYNLSVALKDKGDLANAKAAAERVVTLLQRDTNSPDYKAASDYLASLNAAIATGSAAQNTQTAPAAQTNSALQNQNLPDVNVADLNNPPQVATPEAVQANPQANVPVSSPTPATSPAAVTTPAPAAAPAQ